MNISHLAMRYKKLAADNSPVILTAIGVAGTVTTAYLTGKATFKAVKLIEDEQNQIMYAKNIGESDRSMLTNKEKSLLVWKLYIPAVMSGTITCGSIIFANRIGTRRTAAMAAAYTLSERAYGEYRDKVVETFGRNKEEKVRADVQQDRVNANPPSQSQILVASGGSALCKDAWSGRYFTSDMETIKKAQNDTNYEVLNHGYASLSDFYNRLGLENTKESDDVGWNSDKLLEVTFTSAISDDQKPVLVMDFVVAPIRNFFRTH